MIPLLQANSFEPLWGRKGMETLKKLWAIAREVHCTPNKECVRRRHKGQILPKATMQRDSIHEQKLVLSQFLVMLLTFGTHLVGNSFRPFAGLADFPKELVVKTHLQDSARNRHFSESAAQVFFQQLLIGLSSSPKLKEQNNK